MTASRVTGPAAATPARDGAATGTAPPARAHSLFWTITGMFLLTVLLGTVLQVLLVGAVLRPLEARDARSRAELAAQALAQQLETAPALPTGQALDSLLARRREALGPRAPWIAFHPRGQAPETSPRDRAPFVAVLLASGGTRAALPDSARAHHPWSHVELLARRPVVRSGVRLGDVVVARPEFPWFPPVLGPVGMPAWLLFLPVAVIASTLAGAIMLRLLVGRLRALETLAGRVAEGDFSVRVEDRHHDEIGRLAERLNGMTERLDQARAELERHERQRRQLFADITHELATPLTSIRGYAETMLDPSVPMTPEERARYVRGTLEEARRLDRLTRDLFELARLEAGATPLMPEPLDLAALARNTTARFEQRFQDAGLTLRWRASPREAWLEADGRRLEQMLDNLLANALRYVPSGGTVELALDRPTDHPDRLRLTVADDGPGIHAAELPHVFERFYRANGQSATPNDVGGSGLGLAIVREIVTRHGGSVRAESRAPHGLAIIVELPAQAAAA